MEDHMELQVDLVDLVEAEVEQVEVRHHQVVQEILHQYLHHKEIRVQAELLEIITISLEAVVVQDQEQHPILLLQMLFLLVEMDYQSLGYRHLTELQDLLPVDTLLEEVEVVQEKDYRIILQQELQVVQEVVELVD
jgi:hypothetical protein